MSAQNVVSSSNRSHRTAGHEASDACPAEPPRPPQSRNDACTVVLDPPAAFDKLLGSTAGLGDNVEQ